MDMLTDASITTVGYRIKTTTSACVTEFLRYGRSGIEIVLLVRFTFFF